MDQAYSISRASVNELDRALLIRMLRDMRDPPISLMLWNGEKITTHTCPESTLRFNSRSALLRTALNPEVNFGDLYVKADLELVQGSLQALIQAVYNQVSFDEWGERKRLTRLPRLSNITSLNGRRSARDNIHHHYDIGNDFYRLWLDDAMQYTCAYFREPAMSLAEAQLAKLDHVCRKLRLAPGQSVVEAGSGWGGLAMYMARQYGVRVRAYNISSEQVRFAREKAHEFGLSAQVEFIEEDYADIKGEYDAFVSVGMLEHVGPDNYATLGRVIRKVLRSRGLALIHTIGRNSAASMHSWIEKRIFPGAYPPSMAEMMQIFEPNGFSILDVENLRLHYRNTLRCWLENYDNAQSQITAMFDAEFYRTWQLYLAGSVATFDVGRLQLFQVLFTHERNNLIPMTRAHLYHRVK